MELSEWFCVNCKGAMQLLFCEHLGERAELVRVFIYLGLFLSPPLQWHEFSFHQKKKENSQHGNFWQA